MEQVQGRRSIAIDCSKEEYTDYTTTVFKPGIKKYVVANGVFALFASGLAFIMPPEPLMPLSWFLYLTAFAVFVGALTKSRVLRKQYAKIYDVSQNLWIKRAYTIDEDGIRTEGHDGSYGFTPWKSVLEIKESRSGLYFMLSTNIALIVPARGFPSVDDYDKYKSFAKQRLEVVRSGQEKTGLNSVEPGS